MNNKWERTRHRIHEIIFESETSAGRAFDIALLALILLSVLTVILESVAVLASQYGAFFDTCPSCSRQGHDPDAVHCKYCGARL